MAAPTLVGPAYTVSYSSLEEITLTIIFGFTAGNTVGVLIQSESDRTVSSLTDGTNSYAEIIRSAGVSGQFFAHIHAKTNISSLSAGGTVTLTLSGVSNGRLTAQEITASTYSTLSDSFARSGVSTSQQCGATGLTTTGDVFVFAAAMCSGDHAGYTPDDGYSTLTTPNSETANMYKASDTALSSSVAPFTTTNARGVSGVMAAFYAAVVGGGGGGSIVFNMQIG